MSDKTTVRDLLAESEGTFASAAGIRLADTPAPLFRLLVLAQLLSTRISADIAVAAAEELFAATFDTPKKMAKAEWQALVDALGRGHYKRYDESTATRLGANATMLLDTYGGDLRRLAKTCDGSPERAAELLQEFDGIGPTGADIFLREVQDVWTWVRPYFDKKTRTGAQKLGLPTDPAELAALAPRGRTAELAAALIRASS